MPLMRVQNAVLAVVLCLFSTVATADIVRIAPSNFTPSGEDFIAIYGNNLLGTVATKIVFDGTITVDEPQFASQNEILVWVPVAVLVEEGQHSVVVHSIDAGGTRTHGPAFFTVAAPPPSGPPTVYVPDGVIVAEAENANGAVVELPVSAFSAEGDPLPVTCTPASGSRFPLGVTGVQCSATDDGGTGVGNFSVFVTDTTRPVITVPDDIVTSDPVVTYTVTATDNVDGQISVSCTPASGSTFPNGSTRVRCTARDAHFNPAEEEFRVRVTGGPPQLELPEDITAEATGPNGAVVTFAATSEDGTVACTPSSGSTFAIGTTTVNCTATNAGGTRSGSFKVTVEDTTPPVLTTPVVLHVEATSAAGAVATWVATAYDLVDGDRPVTCTPASGSFFDFGTTVVFCSAVDSRNNEGASNFNVIVEDTSAPELTNLTANPSVLWPPNHKMAAVTVTATVVDAVDPSPTVRIASVSSNQPINGTGDGDTAPDWEITGPLTVNLRAERSGNKERVYTIVVETKDVNGNIGHGTVQVKVTDVKRRAVR